jgi:hypothetical protein
MQLWLCCWLCWWQFVLLLHVAVCCAAGFSTGFLLL